MSALRALIVDDEELARRVVREMLAPHADIEIVAECANGFEAVKAVGRAQARPAVPRHPDAEARRLRGARTGRAPSAAVVFVTAYDEYALRAFEVHAVDYLLKPFSQERLADALERARAGAAGANGVRPRRCVAAARRAATRRPSAHRARRRAGARHPRRRSSTTSRRRTTTSACTPEGRSTSRSRRWLEPGDVLDPARFVRIHRSYIVNIERHRADRAVREGQPRRDPADGTRLPVSRAGYARLRELLGDQS